VADADDFDVTRLAHTLFILLVALVAVADAAAYYLLPLPETVREVIYIADSFCAVILLIDVAARWRWSRRKVRFLLPWGLLDLIGSLPFLPFLRFFRLPYLLRTGWRLRRMTPAEARLQARRRLAESTLLLVGAGMLVLVIASSIAVVLVEATSPKANIVTGGDAVWWSIVTITTVGYGDYYPVTRGGRVIGVALMFGGVTQFSVLTSFLAASFVRLSQPPAGAPAAPTPAVEPTRDPS
jgi:voltage-gated potassium channel